MPTVCGPQRGTIARNSDFPWVVSLPKYVILIVFKTTHIHTFQLSPTRDKMITIKRFRESNLSMNSISTSTSRRRLAARTLSSLSDYHWSRPSQCKFFEVVRRDCVISQNLINVDERLKGQQRASNCSGSQQLMTHNRKYPWKNLAVCTVSILTEKKSKHSRGFCPCSQQQQTIYINRKLRE